MTDQLPRDRVTDAEAWNMKCPWCGADVEEATVSLQDLHHAYTSGELRHVRRTDDGEADERALVAGCPECARPFAIALQQPHLGAPAMRLLAVRTKADLKLLREGPRPANAL